MFDLKKNFQTNKKLEEEGVEIKLSDTASVVVARSNCNAAKEMIARETKPYAQILRTQTPAARELGNTIMKKVYAEVILKGWSGIFDDGKEVAFSKENALEYFNKYPDFYEIIVEISNNTAAYRDDEVEADAKNSKNSLSGS